MSNRKRKDTEDTKKKPPFRGHHISVLVPNCETVQRASFSANVSGKELQKLHLEIPVTGFHMTVMT